MEQFNRNNQNDIQQSRVSSVSSLDSINDSAYSNYNGSSKNLHTRSVSLMPSYMKHAPITRKPVAAKRPVSADHSTVSEVAPSSNQSPAIPPPERKGTLLLAIARSPHHSVIFYVQSMLKKLSYKRIVILGNLEQETGLKQLKVDIYALLGRLGQEVAVQMDLQNSWSDAEIDAAVSKGTAEGDAIQGVLCSPDYQSNLPSSIDVMALDQDQLGLPWKSSVGFLHSVAKNALPNFRSTGHEYKQPSLFLVTSPSEQTSTSTLYNAGCRTLMTLLVEANAGKNLTIDYAENVILPEPEVEPQPQLPAGPTKARSNGGPKLSALDTSREPEPEEFPPPESPTKLWALYSQFEEGD